MSVMLSVLTGLYAWGGSIDQLLVDLQLLGIFDYVLPFLLVFAVVFGILMNSGVLGSNRGVNFIVALSLGLLAMQSFALRSFFHTIFPYAGIGIAILLVALILTGLFQWDQAKYKKTFFYIGLGVAIVVIIFSLQSQDWAFGWWWSQYWSAIVTVGLLIFLMVMATRGWGTPTPAAGGGGH